MKYLYYICVIALSLTSCVEKIAPTMGTIFGVVKDVETTEPLGECNVVLMPTGESTITGEDGTFHFEDIFPDNYSVEVSSYNYNSNKKSVLIIAGNTTSVDVLLTKTAPTTGTIFGVVKNAKTAEPLGGCNVVLMPTGESTVTGGDGAFHFEDVLPDNYSVEVSCYNYYSNKKSVLIIAGNTTSVDVLLTKYDPNNRLAELGAMNVSEITYNSVRVSSEIVDQGSSSITESGFLYSELPNITIATATKLPASSIEGIFSTTIKGLTERTTYYVAPYAINGRGTAYGDVVPFTTGDAAVIPLPSNVIFVSVSGNDSNDGSSWRNAKRSIEAAFDIATEGKQIWVSIGSYNETIYPNNLINIYGGFSGTETDISQRKNRTNVRGIYCSHFTAETIINGFTCTSNEMIRLKNYAILENCVISGYSSFFRAIEVMSSKGVVIENCIIENNDPGGYGNIIENSFSSLRIINTHFRGNRGNCISSEGTLVMYNCVLTNNELGVRVSRGAANLYNCTMANNGTCLAAQGPTNIYNCLIWNDEHIDEYYGSSSGTINAYSCIEVSTANNSGVKLKKPSQTEGPDAADWQTADWSITAGSSCINAGTNLYFPIDDIPTDIAGRSRITGTTIDIGAYEY